MPKRVLIVEDMPLMSGLLAKMVATLGAKSTIASTLAEAKAELEAEIFDLIIWDGYLGSETTFDLVRKTRKLFKGKMIAHSSTHHGMKQLLDAGCDEAAPGKGDVLDILKRLL